MGKQLIEITDHLKDFIEDQHVFFVGTAAEKGRINISPKGMDSLRVLGPNKVTWLNLTGSGNETAAHLIKHDRMTIMFCAFEGKPMILRLYGHARAFHRGDNQYEKYIEMFDDHVGSRQIIVMEVDLVQTSCGFGVPLMDYASDRTLLNDWASAKGVNKIKSYWAEKNVKSIDGFDTGIKLE